LISLQTTVCCVSPEYLFILPYFQKIFKGESGDREVSEKILRGLAFIFKSTIMKENISILEKYFLFFSQFLKGEFPCPSKIR